MKKKTFFVKLRWMRFLYVDFVCTFFRSPFLLQLTIKIPFQNVWVKYRWAWWQRAHRIRQKKKRDINSMDFRAKKLRYCSAIFYWSIQWSASVLVTMPMPGEKSQPTAALLSRSSPTSSIDAIMWGKLGARALIKCAHFIEFINYYSLSHWFARLHTSLHTHLLSIIASIKYKFVWFDFAFVPTFRADTSANFYVIYAMAHTRCVILFENSINLIFGSLLKSID